MKKWEHLLLCGDAKKRADGPLDPLFGHAGTATAVEYSEGSKGFQFHFGTDGSGFDAIITPDGGSRNQITPKSFELEEVDGKMMHRLQTHMKGMDVFGFGISTAPKTVKKLGEHYGFDYQTADYFVFHQANMKMNNMIAKKLKLESEKVPSCMYEFGNTSSASDRKHDKRKFEIFRERLRRPDRRFDDGHRNDICGKEHNNPCKRQKEKGRRCKAPFG